MALPVVQNHQEADESTLRTFLVLWATQSLSVLGSGLTFFATTIWLTTSLYPLPEQKAELALALSANGLAFALPTVFGAPFAGAWADRHDRKQTMFAADLLSGLVAFLMAALMASGTLQIWSLLLLTAAFALLGSYHSSAFFASYASIVPQAHLPRANGMMFATEAGAGIFSPALAAGLIALPALARQGVISGPPGAALATLGDGAPLAIGIDGASFLMAASVLPFLRIGSPSSSQAGKVRRSFLADIAEGATYIWARRPLLWLLGTFTVANFVGSPIRVFQPLITKFRLAEDWMAQGMTLETALALLVSLGGLGGLAGGILISAWGGLGAGRRVLGVVIPMLISAVAGIVFGLSVWLYVTAAAAFLINAMMPILNAHSQAIWQAQVPSELQGRVFAVRRVIAQCTWPVSTLLAGVISGVLDPGVVTAALSAGMAVFCLAQLANSVLRRVEDREWLERMAARHSSRGTAPPVGV